MQEELVDRGMPIGPKGVDIEQFAEQVKLIRLATKQSSLCDREVSRARLTGARSWRLGRARGTPAKVEADLLEQVSREEEYPAKDQEPSPAGGGSREWRISGRFRQGAATYAKGNDADGVSDRRLVLRLRIACPDR